MQEQTEDKQWTWKQLIERLPTTTEQVSAAIRRALETHGYLHLTWPMTMENYEAIAGRVGTIVQKNDVKVDLAQAQRQEQARRIKGRGGIYSPGALGFHTDPIADLVSWYCMEQDEHGGPMMMLDLGDLEEHFSAEEREILSRVELLSPTKKPEAEQETLTPTPLLTKINGKYKIYYAPWLLRESEDASIRKIAEKFAAYVKNKEETQLIVLPIKPHDTVFLNNHRMLHGRGELSQTSKRHLVRFYLRAA
ncbi:MAG TPA: TauD/TfdA family dioxygenase [Candidatus Angelobacter sp.]